MMLVLPAATMESKVDNASFFYNDHGHSMLMIKTEGTTEARPSKNVYVTMPKIEEAWNAGIE